MKNKKLSLQQLLIKYFKSSDDQARAEAILNSILKNNIKSSKEILREMAFIMLEEKSKNKNTTLLHELVKIDKQYNPSANNRTNTLDTQHSDELRMILDNAQLNQFLKKYSANIVTNQTTTPVHSNKNKELTDPNKLLLRKMFYGAFDIDIDKFEKFTEESRIFIENEKKKSMDYWEALQNKVLSRFPDSKPLNEVLDEKSLQEIGESDKFRLCYPNLQKWYKNKTISIDELTQLTEDEFHNLLQPSIIHIVNTCNVPISIAKKLDPNDSTLLSIVGILSLKTIVLDWINAGILDFNILRIISNNDITTFSNANMIKIVEEELAHPIDLFGLNSDQITIVCNPMILDLLRHDEISIEKAKQLSQEEYQTMLASYIDTKS